VDSAIRACPVCQQCRPRRFGIRDGVQFVRCGVCACLYQGTEPDQEQIRGLYRDEYHRLRGHHENSAIEAAKRATARHYLRMLEPLHPPGRQLVEVGCSTGAGLAAAAELGWDVQGVELSAAAAEIARQRPGVRGVYTAGLQDAPLPGGQADALVLFDVIEHIEPPDAALAALHRLLRPGGLLLMVTPDAGSLSARLMRARWPHLLVEHLVLFSRQAMRGSLEAAGFRIERIGFAWKRVNFEMLARHAALHPHVAFAGLLGLMDRLLPDFLRQASFPFNLGEFYVVASKART